MGIGRYMVRGIAKELDNKSREFYEFVMPAIDMFEDGNDLVVAIDLPGFAKKDINLRINANILSIIAKREQDEVNGTVYYRHDMKDWLDSQSRNREDETVRVICSEALV